MEKENKRHAHIFRRQSAVLLSSLHHGAYAKMSTLAEMRLLPRLCRL